MSVFFGIQDVALCRSNLLYATIFKMVLFADLVFYMPLYFKMLPFAYPAFYMPLYSKYFPSPILIPIRFKKLPTTRTGRHSARLRPSAGFFSSFRSECTAEAQDTGWLCFCRRGALLRWRESALLEKIQLFERRRSEFWIFFSGFSRFPAS